MSTLTTAFGKIVEPDHIVFARSRITRNDACMGELREIVRLFPETSDRVAERIRCFESSNASYRKVLNEWNDRVLADEGIYLETGATDHLVKYFPEQSAPVWLKGGAA